ncbi:cobalamin B12-binding domain-containing protein [Chloroflexota bacterium]
MAEKKRIKVLIAKPGLDGHDRGAMVVVEGLKDEGMEVIYTGRRQTPEMIAAAAVQERVDVVGLSSMTGAHKYLFSRVVELLKEKGVGDILVIGGGIIPGEDASFLKEKGVKAILGPGTSIKTISDFIKQNVKR